MLDLRRAAWLLATLVACGPPPATGTPAAPSDGASAPVAIALSDDPAVRHDDFARHILYTWTTAAQIDALRTSRRLLVAEAHHGDERSPFLRALDDLLDRRAAGHELAALLRDHPGLARRRYAWTSPLATILGLGARRYGDALIRVELDPAGLVVAFRPAAAEPFAAVDMSGRPVSLDLVLRDPGRIAAVYHVRDGPRDPVAFREYVLCNEARVLAWSIATPEIRARVDADIALLESLATGDFAHLPDPAVQAPAALAWATAPAVANPLDRWHALLAFDNERYRPSPGNLARIAAALRQYDGRGDPLVHRPAAVFP